MISNSLTHSLTHSHSLTCRARRRRIGVPTKGGGRHRGRDPSGSSTSHARGRPDCNRCLCEARGRPPARPRAERRLYGGFARLRRDRGNDSSRAAAIRERDSGINDVRTHTCILYLSRFSVHSPTPSSVMYDRHVQAQHTPTNRNKGAAYTNGGRCEGTYTIGCI